jgi:hypothetical protein
MASGIIALAISCSLSMRRIDLLEGSTTEKAYGEGIEKIRKSKKLYTNINRLLYFLDQGILFHYDGAYDSSIVQLQLAEEVIDELYARSITNEAAALMTNDLLRPYRGRRYERVLLHQFLMFNYLAKNEFDEALVETRKIQLVLDSYKEKDRFRDKYQSDGMSHYISSIVYEAQSERDNSLISLFKSVKAYQTGPLSLPDRVAALAYHKFMHHDREEDVRLLNLAPSVPVDTVPATNDDSAEIVVIGYGGRGPVLGETVFSGTYIVGGLITGAYRTPEGETIRVALPAPPLPESEIKKLENKQKTKAGTTFHIKFALPAPVPRQSQTAYFTVGVRGLPEKYKTVVLANTDILLANDIANSMPVTLTRTALRVVLRTLAAQKAKSEVQTSSPLANLVINVGTDVLADQLERADTRLCFLYPKTIQCARIAVPPGSHSIEIRALSETGAVVNSTVMDTVEVHMGEKKFLFYPSVK